MKTQMRPIWMGFSFDKAHARFYNRGNDDEKDTVSGLPDPERRAVDASSLTGLLVTPLELPLKRCAADAALQLSKSRNGIESPDFQVLIKRVLIERVLIEKYC